MATIQFNGHQVSPESQQQGGRHYVSDASGSDYILVHCLDALSPSQADELKHCEVEVLHYVGKNTYSCLYEGSDLTKIRELPFVVYANTYHNHLVISPDLEVEHSQQSREDSLPDPIGDEEKDIAQQRFPLFHVFLHHQNRAGQTIEALYGISSVDRRSVVDEGFGILRARFDPRVMDKVAGIDNVSVIQEVGKFTTLNQKSRNVLSIPDLGAAAASVTTFSAASGATGAVKSKADDDWGDLFADFARVKISRDPMRGAGQIIVVADTGLDKGDAGNVHDAFKGRVLDLKSFHTAANPFTTSDTDGHGTHVAASVLGTAWSKDFNMTVEGSAPDALLVVAACFTDEGLELFGEPDATMQTIFTYYLDDNGPRFKEDPKDTASPWLLRSRIHNNSWGMPWSKKRGQTPYDGLSRIVDGLVRQNQDWVIVVCGGNDGEEDPGSGSGQIISPAGAKNVITVGACENTHNLSKQVTPGKSKNEDRSDYAYEKGRPNGTPNNVADFSSRGPTLEGTLKPDVVAPGAVVYSARSGSGDLKEAEVKDSTGAVKYNYKQNGDNKDSNWWYLSGTSMAAPFVSGCCAVIRNMYCAKHAHYPSAAMVKALLVNGADDMSRFNRFGRGTSFGDSAAPNRAQGWGRVNLENSLRSFSTPGGCYDSRTFSADNKPDVINASLAMNGPGIQFPAVVKVKDSTLIVTLAWTDPPTAAGASGVTNLVIFDVWPPSPPLITPEPISSLGEKASNVQRAVIEHTVVGTYFIKVKCKETLQTGSDDDKKQDFALCWDIREPLSWDDL